MGKAFDTELKNLPSTYEYANNRSEKTIQTISSFIQFSKDTPLLLVGSGGSFSAAKAFESLHCISGMENIFKAVTPLGLYSHINNLHSSSAVILSANGNNSDTLNAYQLIRRNNSPHSLIICFNEKSKLRKASEEYNTVFTGNRLPAGKDGYLAVNTLFAVIVWLSKAYYAFLKDKSFLLPESFSGFTIPQIRNLPSICDYESIIILYSGISEPIAFDIESKFSEAALGNVILTDYRNFAHGRHLWLDRRGDKTTIVALISPEINSLAVKTLSLIPKNISVIKIETKSPGAKGMLELLLCSFELTKYAGSLSGIDPGKPNVPEYGRKMYHIVYSSKIADDSKQNDSLPNCAIIKKYGFINSEISELYKKHYFSFLNKLYTANFNQLVFDYDATLKERDSLYDVEKKIFSHLNYFLSNNIAVAIATGRGKSVRIEMQNKILCDYWDRVRIGYYNGGDISLLSDNNSPNINIKISPFLQKFAKELSCKYPDLKYDLRPKQLTVFISDITKLDSKNIILELARKHRKIKAFMSGHSIDIIPIKTSKLNLIDYNSKAICIGDSGQFGGNDYELLSHEYSLSVNNTSLDFDSCWNLAPLGVTNSRATLFYLDCMEVIDGYLKFNFERLGAKLK